MHCNNDLVGELSGEESIPDEEDDSVVGEDGHNQ